MRLFIALDLDDGIRRRIARFIEGVSGFASDARWVKPASMHVTLKFIGEQPEIAVDPMKQALSKITASTMEIRFRGTGFFPTAKSPRVFWVGIEAGPELAALSAAIDDQVAMLGIPKEDRAFTPHLTLARGLGGSGSPRMRTEDAPNRTFHPLQEKLSARPAPEFGTMTAREFFLYQSELWREGSKYTKLAGFKLV
jgi:2'-5' RNA ligase